MIYKANDFSVKYISNHMEKYSDDVVLSFKEVSEYEYNQVDGPRPGSLSVDDVLYIKINIEDKERFYIVSFTWR